MDIIEKLNKLNDEIKNLEEQQNIFSISKIANIINVKYAQVEEIENDIRERFKNRTYINK